MEIQQTTPKQRTIMKYDQARILVYNQLLMQLDKQGRIPVFDTSMKNLYRLLTLYFTDNTDFENSGFTVGKNKTVPYSLKRGILLMGNTGRSKSFSFERVFNAFAAKYNQHKKFKNINTNDISLEISTQGASALNRYSGSFLSTGEKSHLYIDELGMEETVINYYGNKFRPMETILHERHKRFIRNGVLTHSSTNLTMIELKEKYGYRTYSRIFEMFNLIDCKGEDLRINIK